MRKNEPFAPPLLLLGSRSEKFRELVGKRYVKNCETQVRSGRPLRGSPGLLERKIEKI